MKTPTARQLSSGQWFVQLRINGQSISITRPTEKAAVAEAMAVKAGLLKAKTGQAKQTVSQAIDSYISARTNVLSPSTIRGYRAIQKGRFQSLMNRDINSISQDQWQRAVNAEAKLCSAKTLQNAWRFLLSVISEATGEKPFVRLPQVIKSERPFLTPDQVSIFVDAIKGTSVEIPALLALSSLRRSELLALKWDNVDLKKGIITVSGSAVYDENEKLVFKKENKNSSSNRIVPIIPPLRCALESAERKGDYVVTLKSAAIFRGVNRACKSANLPEVGVHGLRHSFASLAYHLGMPEKIAMEIGGWSDDKTMKQIYTHIAQDDINAHAAAFTAFFDNANKNANKK